ncbi:MAG: monovalent cation/H(+) antiporter subunit G [Tissierellales bacterium]|jgi:multicomponent Na+:H+ antiporter subunit G|nr:monovalent cation/H(+) antiporter subunit G [Tissierellales bacterium]MBN2828129.1 monovalent cation/H(+) antiporter subunit G [Tissierellales bacterium]
MIRNIISAFLLVSGTFFFIVGTVGILRFPDIYTRAHSSAKCDTLGTILTLLGLCVYNGFNAVSIKIMLIVAFIWITSPTATHIITKAQYEYERRIR